MTARRRTWEPKDVQSVDVAGSGFGRNALLIAAPAGYNHRWVRIRLETIGENRMIGKLISGVVAVCLMVGVGTAFAWDAEGEKNAQAAIAEFKRADPSMDAFFKNASGYAIFPEITKGGIGVGGAGGDGTVFEQGAGVGSSEMSQVTVGLQAGRADLPRSHLLQGQGRARQLQERQLRICRRSVGGRGQDRRVEDCGLRQRRGHLHHGQGRPDVRGQRRRPEVHLRSEIAPPKPEAGRGVGVSGPTGRCSSPRPPRLRRQAWR